MENTCCSTAGKASRFSVLSFHASRNVDPTFVFAVAQCNDRSFERFTLTVRDGRDTLVSHFALNTWYKFD